MADADDRGQGRGFLLVAGAARTLTWLNGGAALLLAAFSLGIVGGDYAPPDLSLPLSAFLLGFAASGLTALFAALAARQVTRRGPALRRGRLFWPALILMLFCYIAALLAFGAGCWTATGAPVDDSDTTDTVYASGA